MYIPDLTERFPEGFREYYYEDEYSNYPEPEPYEEPPIVCKVTVIKNGGRERFTHEFTSVDAAKRFVALMMTRNSNYEFEVKYV